MNSNHHNPTIQYDLLQLAFNHFNASLFGGQLPPLLITLHKQANSLGYYIPAKFEARDGTGTTAELCLNPDTFRGRSDREILSTLVHEMVHHWQQVAGTPPRKAYHDRQWSQRMEAIGLMPSSTGQPGGATTGQRMSHYIIDGGLFDRACDVFLADHGDAIAWQSLATPAGPRKTSKHKFTCPSCGQNAWGAPTLKIACGECELPMLPEGMA